jgi:hypothetical protein
MAFSPLGRDHFKGVERISQESPANRVPSLSLSGMNVLATSRERSQEYQRSGSYPASLMDQFGSHLQVLFQIKRAGSSGATLT